MAEHYVICPLCGFEFEPTDTLCQHGCPMRTLCGLVRCPSCEYEFPERPRPVSWLRRLFRRRGEPEVRACEEFRTAADLRSGETATVVSLLGENARRNRLAVFGLAAGCDITLLQRSPAYVVRVGETDLALDAGIAREIVVRRKSARESASAGGEAGLR